MGMGFQFGQHRLGLWDLSWDLKKTISWEMELGPPLHDPRTISPSLLLSWTNFLASSLLIPPIFITPNSKHHVFVPRKLDPFTKQINKSLTWPFYYRCRQSFTTFYWFKLAVTRMQIHLGDSCQLTRNSFKYSFLSQCFSRDTNLSYFHDRQLLRFGRHFEQVCFKDSREEFAKRAIQSFLIWANTGRVIFIGRE